MFNLKSHNIIDETELLRAELRAFDITNSGNGYDICIGDEKLSASTLPECLQLIDSGTIELKQHLFETWHELRNVAQKIVREDGRNTGSLDNLIFLSAVKKSIELSSVFTDLQPVTKTIQQILDTDIASSDDRLIQYFNDDYLRIQCLHRLMMVELYRKHLVQKFMTVTKQSQISGPWANLDLPMEERMWEWDEGEEEYFANRKKSRREQIRYNPENQTKSGFYYVWQDHTRDPYRFEDMKEDSPYKSRTLLTVP